MKKIITVWLFCWVTSPFFAQKKFALIVTIDKYPQYANCQNCWQSTSADTDLDVIWQIFHDQQHFDVVDTVTESHATRKGILKALDDLKAKADTGSIVVFHFSGHGQQIYDVNDQERGLFIDEADGYDEALVPYDARRVFDVNGYKGENHIRDEELGAKLDSIRKKIGIKGSLLVLADACYSGTITKDVTNRGIFRGSKDKFEPPGYQRAQRPGEKSFLSQNSSASFLAPMVVISGSAQDQLNYSRVFDGGRRIGALTYAFMKALANYHEPVSYKVFFEWIRQTIEYNRTGQTPLIEGDDSLMVLGNTVIHGEQLIKSHPVKSHPDTVIIERGMLHDIYKGMEFSLYQIDAPRLDSSTILAKGKIIAVDPFSSKGALNKKLNDSIPYQAVFTSKAFGEFNCSISIKGNSTLLLKIKEMAGAYKILALDDSNPDLDIKIINIGIAGQKKLYVLEEVISDQRYDTIWKKDFLRESDIDSSQLADLFASIKQYARAKYMRSFSLPINDTTFNSVTVQVIPVIARDSILYCEQRRNASNNPVIVKYLPGSYGHMNKNWAEIKAKTQVQASGYTGLLIKLINNDINNAVYLSVLEIQPDDKINIRVPYSYCENDRYSPRNPENFKLAAKDSTNFWPKVLAFSPPYGLEYLKIIISDKPLNLEGLSKILKSAAAHKNFDEFLNEILNDDSYLEKKTVRKGDLPVTTAPVRPGSLKVVTYKFNLVE